MFFTLIFLLASRLASLSCDVAQWIPLSRIRLFSLMCCEKNRPFFLRMTRTESNTNASARKAMTMSICFIDAYY